MAKVIAPFKLSGTLDDINFVNTLEGNIARMKREKFMTSKEFMANPIYDRIREHGKEMGYASRKSRIFRLLAVQFYKKSKDVSFAGRANKIILEILKEDSLNSKGKRTLEEGMKSPFLHEILLGFEGNKNKPLSKVLQKGFEHFPAPSVKALDTTAAGDTFVGGFAAALVAGMSEAQAIRFGQVAAALSVTRAGAQPSIPTLADVQAFKTP